MPMTKEELMIPRYKVIADYPGSDFSVNETIEVDENGDSLAYDERGRVRIGLKYYPHLFKKLEWHEERKTEDMPEYARVITKSEYFETGKVLKVNDWQYIVSKIGDLDESWWTGGGYHVNHLEPATESEYLSYMKSKNNPSKIQN